MLERMEVIDDKLGKLTQELKGLDMSLENSLERMVDIVDQVNALQNEWDRYTNKVEGIFNDLDVDVKKANKRELRKLLRRVSAYIYDEVIERDIDYDLVKILIGKQHEIVKEIAQ